MPRVIGATEWARVEAGLAQRIAALNLFLDDMYGEQKILKQGVIPADLVLAAKPYESKLRGIKPAGRTAHKAPPTMNTIDPTRNGQMGSPPSGVPADAAGPGWPVPGVVSSNAHEPDTT